MPKADVLRNRRLRAAVVLSLAGMLNASGGFVGAAITGTWNATPTDNNWITNGTENNWNSTPGVFPGTTGTTTNGDTALFNTAVNTTAVPGGVISLSSDLNILNINFDTSAGSYTIGSLGSGGNLLLSDGGALSLLSTLTANSRETFNASLVLEGNYAFTDNATGSKLLNIAGNVSSGLASGTSTLTLNGSNATGNDAATGANLISGAISDGTSGGVLAITKSGAGVWALSGANTYSGATTVSAGALEILSSTALGNTSRVTVSNGAEVQIANNLTISGRSITIAGNGVADNFGALKATGTGTTTWAGNVTIGLDQARLGVTNSGATLIVSGVIDSGSNTFGPAIRVPNTGGTVEFTAANTYKGNTGVVVGTLLMGATNTLPATTTVNLGNNALQGAATLDLNGFDQTIAGISVTNSNIPSTVTASSPATLTLKGSSTFGSSLAGQITGAVSLNKSGAGTFQLAGVLQNTYTGATTASGGTFLIDASANAANTNTDVGEQISGTSGLVLNGGTLTLKGRANGTTTSVGNASYTTANAVITLSSGNTSGLAPGQSVSSSLSGIPAGAFITTINGTTSFTISATPTVAGTGATLSLPATSNLTTQTFPQTTVAGGSSFVTVNVNSGSGTTLNLASLTRTAPNVNGTGGGTVDFNIPTNGTITTTSANTDFGSAGGQQSILGGWATVAGKDWAVSAGDGSNPGPITALTSYATSDANSFGGSSAGAISGQDVDFGANNTAPGSAAAQTINSLRFNSATNNTLTLPTATSGVSLTIASGGILVTSAQTTGGTITGGTLTSGNGTDIILIDNGVGNFAINSVMKDNGSTPIGFTKSGTGQYITNTQHTYSGPTTLMAGSVIPQSFSTVVSGVLKSGPFGIGTLVLDGASIRATTSTPVFVANPLSIAADTGIPTASPAQVLAFSGAATIQNGTRTLTDNSPADVVFAGPIGDGGNACGLNLAGSGRVVLTGANTYTGGTTVASTSVLAGTTAGIQGNVVNNGSVVFDQTLPATTYKINTTNFTYGGATIANNTGTYAGNMSGSGAVTINAGTVALGGANSYAGTTLVKSATLLANSLSPAGSTGTGTVNVGDSTGGNGFSGVLAGSGNVSGSVNVYSGSTLSAGSGATSGATGLLRLNTNGGVKAGNTFTTSLNSGASYNVKINDAAGTPGSTDGWDSLTMNQVAVSSTGAFTVNLISLNGTAAGDAANFNSGQSYTWLVAQVAQGTSASSLNAMIAANNLVLNTAGFSNAPSSPSFQLVAMDAGSGVTNLDVVYAPAPEPTSLALLGIGAAGVLLRRRRRC